MDGLLLLMLLFALLLDGARDGGHGWFVHGCVCGRVGRCRGVSLLKVAWMSCRRKRDSGASGGRAHGLDVALSPVAPLRLACAVAPVVRATVAAPVAALEPFSPARLLLLGLFFFAESVSLHPAVAPADLGVGLLGVLLDGRSLGRRVAHPLHLLLYALELLPEFVVLVLEVPVVFLERLLFVGELLLVRLEELVALDDAAPACFELFELFAHLLEVVLGFLGLGFPVISLFESIVKSFL